MAARRPSRQHDLVRVRVGNHISKHELHLMSLDDARLFAQTVDEHVRHSRLLIITIDDYRPWLEEVLAAAFSGPLGHLTDLHKEVQFSTTSRLPEKNRNAWTFIIDQINVPEVFFWSVDLAAPRPNDREPLNLSKARLRTGAWVGGPGSCRFDSSITTAIIFTKSDMISNAIVDELLFPALYKDAEGTAVCVVFSRLFWLFTDWQNILRELNARLADAEVNSHHREYPVKYRTRAMHREVARIHEFKDYLRFHMRSFNKLQKLQNNYEIDDVVDDLAHYEENLDSIKERFNNLLGLEFNLQAADQSEGAAFLSIVATLFLPLSYLTSLWGISTSDWATIWYVCAAVIVFGASAAFLFLYPWLSKKWQRRLYHLDQSRILLRRQDFTMMGEDLPDNVDVPGRPGRGISRHRSQQLGGMQLRRHSRPEPSSEQRGTR